MYVYIYIYIYIDRCRYRHRYRYISCTCTHTQHPGIFLGGNYVCGVAFGSCVEWGVNTAPDVVKYLRQAPGGASGQSSEAKEPAAPVA